MALNMKTKYDKYFGSVKKINKLIFIDVVLDPRCKLDYVSFYFSNLYEDDVSNRMVDSIKIFLMRLYDFYKSRKETPSSDNHPPGSSFTSMSMSSTSGEMSESVLSRYKKRREEKSCLELKNDVERYLSDLSEEMNDNFDVLAWWKMNDLKYRTLSKIARDVLAVPVSTVASESTFSTGGRILDPFRSSLTPQTIQALICTQNWIRGKSVLIDLSPQLEELETCEKIESGFRDLYNNISMNVNLLL